MNQDGSHIKPRELGKLNKTIHYFQSSMVIPLWIIGPRPELSVATLRVLGKNLVRNISKRELKKLFTDCSRIKELKKTPMCA